MVQSEDPQVTDSSPAPSEIVRLERENRWLEAAQRCSKMSSPPQKQDPLEIAKSAEHTGYAFYRAAMQSETSRGFQDLVNQSIAEYERAGKLYAGAGTIGNALSPRSQA